MTKHAKLWHFCNLEQFVRPRSAPGIKIQTNPLFQGNFSSESRVQCEPDVSWCIRTKPTVTYQMMLMRQTDKTRCGCNCSLDRKVAINLNCRLWFSVCDMMKLEQFHFHEGSFCLYKWTITHAKCQNNQTTGQCSRPNNETSITTNESKCWSKTRNSTGVCEMGRHQNQVNKDHAHLLDLQLCIGLGNPIYENLYEEMMVAFPIQTRPEWMWLRFKYFMSCA